MLINPSFLSFILKLIMSPLKLNDINSMNVCISVADIDATIAWYERILNFKLIQRLKMQALGAELAFLKYKNIEIELVALAVIDKFVRPPPPTEHLRLQGLSQISFRVDNVEKTMDLLRRKGINLIFGPVTVDELMISAFFIRDNEGNLIEFLQRI
jgi:catechol 2,3-dioxygenase-like lactoylglutathione lyase family enzyme